MTIETKEFIISDELKQRAKSMQDNINSFCKDIQKEKDNFRPL